MNVHKVHGFLDSITTTNTRSRIALRLLQNSQQGANFEWTVNGKLSLRLYSVNWQSDSC